MELERYRAKRKFDRPSEPYGGAIVSDSSLPRFVVQRHDAKTLHYDLRLEYKGVLASWAITSKPFQDKRKKQLAIKVEDHPLEYQRFQGYIAKGQYGAGVVRIWDHGFFLLEGATDKLSNDLRLEEKFKKGHFIFYLQGSKLKGKFVLTKFKNEHNNWLLYCDQEDNQVMEAEDEESFGFVPPMLPSLADKVFDSPDWVYEAKLDGYRAIAVVNQPRTTIFTRNKQILNARFPELVNSLNSTFSSK